jgi:hypothetical protein
VTTALLFIGALAGIVLLAFVVSRITGARPLYLDTWTPDPGERILFDDRKVRIVTVLVPIAGRREQVIIHPRGFVLVTDRRIVAGQRPLFSKRFLIEYMIYTGHAPGADVQGFGAGVLSRGYASYVVVPGMIRRVANVESPFVELTPSPEYRGSAGLVAIRIHTDRAASFPLPGS